MEIPDLVEFPEAPTPEGYSMPIAGAVVRMVGWLGDHVTSSGDVREECMDRLMLAYEQNLVLSDGTRGFHVCEICAPGKHGKPGESVGPVVGWRGRELRIRGHGNFLIRHENVVYRAPALILHYILDHDYRPPEEFVEAVILGTFLTPDAFRPKDEAADFQA